MVFLSFRFREAEVFNLGEGAATKDSNDPNEITDFKNNAFVLLMIISCFAIILGSCGISLMMIKHRGCAVLFGCTLLPAWIMTFVFGAMIAIFSNSSKSTIQ